jgi:RNA polymerase sigma factor (sigma-70 family)
MRETERPIAFKPWIYEIAKNACIDQFRRSRRAEEISFDADDGAGALESARLASPSATPDVAIDAKQQLDHLCGAFGGLSETHHQILVLRELEGLSYREIGERMGLSRPSVESTLFRARRRLSEEYDELVSGQRCTRIQTIIATVTEGSLGTRDQRRLARHIAHCQPCRREARLAGLDTATLSRTTREVITAKVAALLPFPMLFRGRKDGSAGIGDGGHGANLVAQWGTTLSSMAEPLTGWTKAMAAAAAVLVAGGAGMGVHELTKGSTGGSPNEGSAIVGKKAPASSTVSSKAGTTAPARSSAPASTRTTRGTKSSDKTTSGAGGGSPASSVGGGARSPAAGTPSRGSGITGGGAGAPGTPSVIRDGPKGDDAKRGDGATLGVPLAVPTTTVPAEPAAEVEKVGTQLDPAVGDAIGDVRDVLGGG